MAELRLVRAQGFAVCDEEMEVGVTAISAPVFDAAGEVSASVTVVAPTERLVEVRRQEALARLRDTSSAISSALGFRGLDGETHGGPTDREARNARLVHA